MRSLRQLLWRSLLRRGVCCALDLQIAVGGSASVLPTSEADKRQPTCVLALDVGYFLIDSI